MKVALFGASGFIGRVIGDRLREEAIEHVRLSHRNRSGCFVPIDFGHPDGYAHLLHGVTTAVLLVAQSRPGLPDGCTEAEIRNDVRPYAAFAGIAAAAGLRHVVYLSSGGTVYGSQPDRTPITEDHPTTPIDAYGARKLMTESVLRSSLGAAGIGLTVLRPSNPVGAAQRFEPVGFVARAAHASVAGTTIDVWGDGSTVRDYFDVADLADAVIRSLGGDTSHRVYNVGSGVGTGIDEVLALVQDLGGRPIRRRYLPARPFDVPVNVLSSDRIARDLGWTVRKDLRRIVSDLLEAFGGVEERHSGRRAAARTGASGCRARR